MTLGRSTHALKAASGTLNVSKAAFRALVMATVGTAPDDPTAPERRAQSDTLANAVTRVIRPRTRSSPGTALRRPNCSADSAPM